MYTVCMRQHKYKWKDGSFNQSNNHITTKLTKKTLLNDHTSQIGQQRKSECAKEIEKKGWK